jgi:hypothetical protein
VTATEGQAYSCKNAAKLLYVVFVLTGSIAKKTCSPVKPYLGIRKSQRRKEKARPGRLGSQNVDPQASGVTLSVMKYAWNHSDQKSSDAL